MDMLDIRLGVLNRIKLRAISLRALKTAGESLLIAEDTTKTSERPGSSMKINNSVKGLRFLNGTLADVLRAEMDLDIDQLGFLIARDVIAPLAREGDEPIVWLTNNSTVPAIRQVDRMEDIWNLEGADDMWFSNLIEKIEDQLVQERVYMAAPEDDNSLYVVDLDRWEFEEKIESCDLNDDWKAKTS